MQVVIGDADEAAFAGMTGHIEADHDIVASPGEVETCKTTEESVLVAGAKKPRPQTHGYVITAAYIVFHCIVTNRGVITAINVTKQRISTNGYVENTGGVGRKRLPTDGSVAVHGVSIERSKTHSDVVIAVDVVRKGSLPKGHVLGARDIEEKGIITYRSVETGVIEPQCLSTNSHVLKASGVELERPRAES